LNIYEISTQEVLKEMEKKVLVNDIDRVSKHEQGHGTKAKTLPAKPTPESEKEEPKRLIRFIDSEYRTLFQIPDGESIRVIYSLDDGREPEEAVCKYEGECHTKIGGMIYHICEFAEKMERLGAKYRPVNQTAVEILPYSEGEEKFYTFNRDEGNTCACSEHGDFGNNGERFTSNLKIRENGLYNAEIQSELQSVIYALRQNVLKDHLAMSNYCKEHPEAKISDGNFSNSNDRYEIYGFKFETASRQYFVNCFAAENKRDSRFSIFAYADKPVPMLEQNNNGKNSPDKNGEGFTSVLGAIDKGKKTPKPPRKEKTAAQIKNKQEEI